jgi:putative transposase
MQLTEQHVISRNDPRYAVIDAAAFASKNLYNAALYEMRQAFFNEGRYLKYEEIQHCMQSHDAYKALPAKVSQQILIALANNWESFKKAKKACGENPSRFTGRPRLPKYKHKTEGRNILIYTMQAISGGQTGGKKTLQRGIIKPSQLPIEIKTRQNPSTIHQVRIVPRNGHYVVEVVYSKEPVQAHVGLSFCVAIDIGVTNLAAITSNREGFVPRLVNGRPIKSVNQWYNKRMKELKLCLRGCKGTSGLCSSACTVSSNRLNQTTCVGISGRRTRWNYTLCDKRVSSDVSLLPSLDFCILSC